MFVENKIIEQLKTGSKSEEDLSKILKVSPHDLISPISILLNSGDVAFDDSMNLMLTPNEKSSAKNTSED